MILSERSGGMNIHSRTRRGGLTVRPFSIASDLAACARRQGFLWEPADPKMMWEIAEGCTLKSRWHSSFHYDVVLLASHKAYHGYSTKCLDGFGRKEMT